MKIKVSLNEEKTKHVDLIQGGTFRFLGFDFRQAKTKRGKISIQKTPSMQARTALLVKLKAVFRKFISQPVDNITAQINPILRGWTNYFRVGNSSRCFGYVKDWVEKKIRRHLNEITRKTMLRLVKVE